MAIIKDIIEEFTEVKLEKFILKCKSLDVSHKLNCLAIAVFFDTGNMLHFQFLPK